MVVLLYAEDLEKYENLPRAFRMKTTKWQNFVNKVSQLLRVYMHGNRNISTFQISENTCISNLFLQSNSTAFVKAYDINYITLFFFYLKPGIGPSNDLSHRPSGSCRHHPSQRSKNGFDILYFYTKFKRPRFCLA